MTHLEALKRSVEYDQWANDVLYNSLRAADSVPERALDLFAHLVSAQQLWLERAQGDDQTLPVWPKMDIAELGARLHTVAGSWALFMDYQRDEKLLRPIAYKNSAGTPWANRIEEIIEHVTLHSAYHRGQIALLMRESGIQPPTTDFIHAIRTGQIG